MPCGIARTIRSALGSAALRRGLRSHSGQLLLLQPADLEVLSGLPSSRAAAGYALSRRIRQHEAEHGGFLPAIALTGYARTDDRARALAAGFQAHAPEAR